MMDVLSDLQPYGYILPEERIAKFPLEKRDFSKLLVIDRKNEKFTHRTFDELPEVLTENDVLVFNQSKVFPARLTGIKNTGRHVEVLLLYTLMENTWRAISTPGLKIGTEVFFDKQVTGLVIGRDPKTGEIDIIFSHNESSFTKVLEKIGKTPIPHYIPTRLSESQLRGKYQTVYAKAIGSVAAPTAGLHFTEALLQKLKKKKIQMEFITLHVGLGTFQTLREEHFEDNSLHTEFFEVSRATAERLNQAKQKGKRIISVGTTTTRTLESVVREDGMLIAKKGQTSLFIHPPYKFKFADSMITNFHLPYSSLLMLVSAFVSYPNGEKKFKNFAESLIGKAYKDAITKKYRFYSFGDAMLIR